MSAMAAAPPPSTTTTADHRPVAVPVQPFQISETFARDAIIAWFRGEFAAANAIIDAAESDGAGGSEYESVFQAIHRRRLNWISVLQMQKYYSIADVTTELRRVSERKAKVGEEGEGRRGDGGGGGGGNREYSRGIGEGRRGGGGSERS
ncbi:hypothetical protein Scep_029572 [Stephania cephalantha]|uniref:Uncharacterized protein n=1 Tax=Stephania cephalantha TaxID=152367 RepID=A0AAP0HG08_9MAGN